MTRRYQMLAALALLLGPWAPLSAAIDEIVELPQAKRGTVYFTHRNHAYKYDVACERCHHNISPPRSDETTCRGCHMSKVHEGLCHACHLSSREAKFDEHQKELEQALGVTNLPPLFRAFHVLCRDCHAESNRKDGTRAPYDCGGCHL